MSFDPNIGPVAMVRDEDGNIVFSVKETGDKLLKISTSEVRFYVAPTGTDDADITTLQSQMSTAEGEIDTLQSQVSTLEAFHTTTTTLAPTTTTTTAGA